MPGVHPEDVRTGAEQAGFWKRCDRMAAVSNGLRRIISPIGMLVWHCDECGCNGVADDHIPGGEMCRLLRVERHEKNRD
jgi:hypothetical protein